MNAPLKPQLPILDLDLLRTLVAIAETGNFSAAADVVFRTPSAVSMQVKRLEALLGKQLFERDSRSVSPTVEGEMLLQHGRRMLALNRDIVTKFVEPDVAGVVRLGAVDHMAEQFLPGLLKRFSETHPGVIVDVVVENSLELSERIRRNNLDIALVSTDGKKYQGLVVEPLHKEALVWAGLKGGVAWETSPLPISVWEEGCVWRKAAIEGLIDSGLDYRVNFMSAYISGQKAAILADMAIAPLPKTACEGKVVELASSCCLPPLGDYTVGLITIENPGEAIKAAIEHLRASFNQLEEA